MFVIVFLAPVEGLSYKTEISSRFIYRISISNSLLLLFRLRIFLFLAVRISLPYIIAY